MCVVGLCCRQAMRIVLTDLTGTFLILYAVNYLGTAGRVFELVLPSSHAWKCSSSREDSCSVPTVVYVEEQDRREIANLRSEPQAISFVALCLFLRLLLPPPPKLIAFFLPSSPQDGTTFLQRFVSRAVRTVPPPYRM
jgi:hypothetical protein